MSGLDELTRVSRLIGADPDLVLHGGGNTSLKTTITDVTGATVETLYVKGSGWDLATIEPAGFAPLRLDRLRALLTLESLSDQQMMNELRCALLDASAPDPSVETLLHAVLPHPAVLHSHADAIVTLTNTTAGDTLVRKVFANRVAVVPYVMPGFALARTCAKLFDPLPADTLGVILMNHGLFTFGPTPQEAYDRHLQLVTEAENFLRTRAPIHINDKSQPNGDDGREPHIYDKRQPSGDDQSQVTDDQPQASGDDQPQRADHDQPQPDDHDRPQAGGHPQPSVHIYHKRELDIYDKCEVGGEALELASIRAEVSALAGAPMIVSRHDESFAARADLGEVARRGPATPDHVIRTKRVPMVGRDLAGYAEEYRKYFAEHAAGRELTMLDPAPRVILDPGLGMLTIGRRARDADIARDIYAHTIRIIERAEALGGYRSLPARDLFEVEYWELEQAKLHRGSKAARLTGEVALVTGAASGIGQACVDALLANGAGVVGLDLAATPSENPEYLGIQADVTDPRAVAGALEAGVRRFGGIDIVVPSAGVFPGAQPIAQLDPAEWRRTMAVNTDAVAALFTQVHPLLRHAPRHGRVVLIASKNVAAPGPGAAAYSASKAAVTQLARVAALEWAADGIRVNVVHPDAVFDTGLWNDDLLAQRATHYGMTVEQYKRRNLLKTEVTSAAVARVVAELCTDTFGCTTGAQIPIDGGNDRVI